MTAIVLFSWGAKPHRKIAQLQSPMGHSFNPETQMKAVYICFIYGIHTFIVQRLVKTWCSWLKVGLERNRDLAFHTENLASWWFSRCFQFYFLPWKTIKRMQNSATFDKIFLPQLTKRLQVNANVIRTEFNIYFSIPVIRYIVFLRLIYGRNVCLFPQGQRASV